MSDPTAKIVSTKKGQLMSRFPKSLQRVAVSAYLHTSAIQAEEQRKFDSAMADADLRICVFCLTTTHAYICPECSDYKGLMTLKDADPYLAEQGKSLRVILTR